MLTYSIVKRIGEGSYLNEDYFIIERARRKRALVGTSPWLPKSRNRIKGIKVNGKIIAS